MAKFLILNQGLAGHTFELAVERATVGSADDNSHQITDPSLSARHCELIRRGNVLWVRDLNSTNGTFLDEQRISESVISPGQVLRLGFCGNETGSAGPRRPDNGQRPHRRPPSPGKFRRVKLFAAAVLVPFLLAGAGVFILMPRGSPGGHDGPVETG